MPTKRGGRPPKYSDHEEARKADLERRRQRYNNRSCPLGPVDFIAYEPPRPPGIPIDTPSEIGLWISQDIRIPPERDAQEDHTNKNNPIPRCPTRIADPLSIEEDAKLAKRIEQIRTDEREQDAEQAKRSQ